MAIAHQLVSQALNTLCEQVRGGSFAVTNSDGATTRYGSDEPLLAVRFNDDNVISLGHDDLLTSFGEAYMDGRVAWKATQRQKPDHSLHKLRLHPHDPLLDIGCGWGALVMRAAEHYQANATGITLSEEQYARVNAAIAEQGLQHKASGRLADDNTLPREGRQFDQIVSIGMIEHVGKDNLAGFVQAVARLLKPGGLALLHSITAVREGSTTQWFERYMFPGAYIPTLLEMITHLGSGLNYFEPGLRLRYEIRREFAPYLGLGWLRRLGGTARIARGDGQDASDLALVVGVRVWH